MTQKTIGLTRPEQIEAYRNAKTAAEARLGEDPTEGEVVQELAEAYTGDYEYDVETATSALERNATAEAVEADPIGEEDDGPGKPPLLLRLASRVGGLVG